MRIRRARAGAFIESAVAVALAFGGVQGRPNLRELLLEIELAGLFQRKQFGELGNLGVEAIQCRVFARDFLRQIELHDDKDAQQEDDAENQRRQRVDESGPVVHAAFAAGASESHGVYLFTFSRTRISRRRRMSRCCCAWESTQSRIICCSVRM